MIRTSIASLLLAALCVAPAPAGLVLQPVAMSITTPTNNGDPGNLINRSGLSIPYTSLVTDFDRYIASNPTHGNLLTEANPFWQMAFNAIPTPSRSVDFDLGGAFTIQSFALWQSSSLQASVRNFQLFADDNAHFTSPQLLGSFEASENSGAIANISSQLFSFLAIGGFACAFASH